MSKDADLPTLRTSRRDMTFLRETSGVESARNLGDRCRAVTRREEAMESKWNRGRGTAVAGSRGERTTARPVGAVRRIGRHGRRRARKEAFARRTGEREKKSSQESSKEKVLPRMNTASPPADRFCARAPAPSTSPGSASPAPSPPPRPRLRREEPRRDENPLPERLFCASCLSLVSSPEDRDLGESEVGKSPDAAPHPRGGPDGWRRQRR